MAGSPLPEPARAGYLDALQRVTAALPAGQREARRSAMQRFFDAGFPSRRHEWWRYTDLSQLADQHYQAAEAAGDAQRHARLPRTDGLVYVNGALDEALSSAPELSRPVELSVSAGDGDEGLQALGTALATPGLDLQLGDNARIARPLHLVLAGTGTAAMVHQRHRIALGRHAQASLIIDLRGDAGTRLSTQTFDIRLAAGAQLSLYRVQDDGAEATLVTRIDAQLAADSRLSAVCIDAGGGLCRNDFNVVLDGRGAEIELLGLYRPVPGAHLDNHTRIIHAQPHGRSRETFRGIVDGRTRAIFNGKVVVAPNAQKTDSEQRIATLLLSRRAEVDTKPELEIHADDVRCAHGATVGQLDATALAYLRSRGIDPDTARALLLQGFAAQILDAVKLPALREDLHRRLGFPGSDLQLDAVGEEAA